MTQSEAAQGNGAAATEPSPRRTPPSPPPVPPAATLSPAKWGMLGFLTSETAFFGTLIAAYISYLGKDRVGPTPSEALSLTLVIGTTACLLSSSVTVHFADRALEQDKRPRFFALWVATITLGILFLAGTAYEWYDLITREHLTIGRNLFGTTFYTLVGFHSFHVTVGVLVMLIVLGLALSRQISDRNKSPVQLVSWYWHFVDGVWVVVFSVVYLVGR
jgi:cytochrome c oxidase subunit 3/cytochrome o ubiquinol oxidase subunit 3